MENIEKQIDAIERTEKLQKSENEQIEGSLRKRDKKAEDKKNKRSDE